MSSAEDITKLKDIIIAHVAKDVLLLTENVDSLKELVADTKNVLEQVSSSSDGYFDNLSKKVIDLLVEMESELRKTGEARVSQISLNISDNVEKILLSNFKNYRSEIDAALTDLRAVNNKAIDSLKDSYNEASQSLVNLKNKTEEPAAKIKTSGKLMAVVLGLQIVTLAALAASFII